MHRRWLGLVLLGPALVWACSDDEATSANSTAPDASITQPCSTGPVQSNFVTLTDTAGAAPACTPRCGAENAPYLNNIAAVPSGSCSSDGAKCDMTLRIGCEIGDTGNYVQGSISGIRCLCQSGNWQCGYTSQGGGVCTSPPAPHDTACATGVAAYGPTVPNAYPPHRAPSSEPASLPECTPRCGETKLASGGPWSPEYGIEALPTGTCQYEGDRCRITAGNTQTCGADTHTCNDSEFECECENALWQCYSTSQGTGACGPCPSETPDASMDASQ